jgi:hypothetical protein
VEEYGFLNISKLMHCGVYAFSEEGSGCVCWEVEAADDADFTM